MPPIASRRWSCLALVMLGSCTVKNYYVTPGAPAAAPIGRAAPGASSAVAEVAPSPSPPVAPVVASAPAPDSVATPAPAPAPVTAHAPDPTPAEQAASAANMQHPVIAQNLERFGVAKAFLIAHRAQLVLMTRNLDRVGLPVPELAPVRDAPGGGFYLALNRPVRELVQHPVVVRIDASGAIVWERDLPLADAYGTYELFGMMPAPDGGVVTMTIPYTVRGDNPRAAMFAKLTPTGTITWSLQLREQKGFDGPYPHELSVDADGTLHLDGHVTDRHPRTDDESARHWTGQIDAAGQVSHAAIGTPTFYDPVTVDAVKWRGLSWFWSDFYWPRT